MPKSMWYSPEWRKRFFAKDLKDMKAYLAKEKNRLKELHAEQKKRHNWLVRQVLALDVISTKYDKEEYRHNIAFDERELRKAERRLHKGLCI